MEQTFKFLIYCEDGFSSGWKISEIVSNGALDGFFIGFLKE